MKTTRFSRPNNPPLPKDVSDLGDLITTLPSEHRAKFETVYQRVVDSTRRRQRILALVQEAISQLRLDMKYLLFDLEATRQERNHYRESLEGDGDK